MKFNSQICTTKEQSKRLLSLGIKSETADLVHYYSSNRWVIVPLDEEDEISHMEIPAWSLHRLLSMLNEDDGVVDITAQDGRYGIHCGYDTEWHDDLYDGIIAVFDTLIKEGYFNRVLNEQ